MLTALSCRTGKDSTTVDLPPLEVNADDSIDLETGEAAEVETELPYRSAADRTWNLISTELDVTFNLARRELDGKAVVTLTPHFYAQQSLTIDAKYFNIRQVTLMKIKYGKPFLEAINPEMEYDSTQVFFILRNEWKRGDTLQLVMEYTARPEEVKSTKISGGPISERKGLYFIDPDGDDPSKPTQIWTQGEPQSSSCWFPTIDQPNQRQSQKISMTVPKGWVTLSNGAFKGSTNVGDSLRKDLWEQALPHAPYLTMMAAGEFSVIKDTWRNMPVWYYVEPEFERYAKMVFGKTPRMIEFYSKVLGVDYPWDKYHQIVVRDFVSGAMENTGAVVHYDALQHDSRRQLDENNEDIISHELFHHWFGDYVTCESWGQLPLNESFATYGEYLWNEYEYGRMHADYYGEKDKQNYLDENEYKQEKLVRDHFDEPLDMFDNHSYAKGGRVLHMLRKTIGDSAFFKGLNKYLRDNAYKAVEMDNLRLAMEDVTGLDLTRFFDQWFYRPGHPDIKVEHSLDSAKNTYTLITRQEFKHGNMPYYIPLDVDFYKGDKKLKRSRIVLSNLTDSFTFIMEDGMLPDHVSFDAEKSVLANITEDKPEIMWVNQLNKGPMLMDKILALKYLADANPELLRSQLPAMLNDSFWGVRESALLFMSQVEVQPIPEVVAEVKRLITNDKNAHVREAALDYLDDLKVKGIEEIVIAACSDSSYRVAGTALSILADLDTAKTVEVINSSMAVSDLEYRLAMADAISRLKSGDYVDFFDKLFSESPEYLKFEVLGSIAAYAENTKGDVRERMIVMLEKHQAKQADGLLSFYLFAIIRQLKKG